MREMEEKLQDAVLTLVMIAVKQQFLLVQVPDRVQAPDRVEEFLFNLKQPLFRELYPQLVGMVEMAETVVSEAPAATVETCSVTRNLLPLEMVKMVETEDQAVEVELRFSRDTVVQTRLPRK